MKILLSFLGRMFFWLSGWTYDDIPDYWEDRCVVIGFPHTSNLDTIRALSYIHLAKVDARLLIKSTWFFFPMSFLLKSLGAIPVEREKSLGFVAAAVRIFEIRKKLVLALVPEGTRKNVTRIKTGFWHIAKGAEVPIICWYLDNGAKRTRWVGRIDPSSSLENDMHLLRDLYEKVGFSIPLVK